MTAPQWTNVLLRTVAWFAAFVFWAYYKKPADASFAAVPTGPRGLVGLALLAFGISLYLWSAITLARSIRGPTEPTNALVTQGPYRHVRNPMYLGGVAAFVGIYVIYAQLRTLDLVAGMLVLLLMHLAVVRLEEPATRKRYGAAYDLYSSQVPRWLPRLRPAPLPPQTR